MKLSRECPECRGHNVFRSKPISAGGGHAPNFLPGLGSFWVSAKFIVVTCRDCGLTRFYAEPEALPKLDQTKKWQRVV